MIYLSMYGFEILCGISKVSVEIPQGYLTHTLKYSYLSSWWCAHMFYCVGIILPHSNMPISRVWGSASRARRIRWNSTHIVPIHRTSSNNIMHTSVTKWWSVSGIWSWGTMGFVERVWDLNMDIYWMHPMDANILPYGWNRNDFSHAKVLQQNNLKLSTSVSALCGVVHFVMN